MTDRGISGDLLRTSLWKQCYTKGLTGRTNVTVRGLNVQNLLINHTEDDNEL
jgi:hypothetical protein